jgi:hypothetical protein
MVAVQGPDKACPLIIHLFIHIFEPNNNKHFTIYSPHNLTSICKCRTRVLKLANIFNSLRFNWYFVADLGFLICSYIYFYFLLLFYIKPVSGWKNILGALFSLMYSHTLTTSINTVSNFTSRIVFLRCFVCLDCVLFVLLNIPRISVVGTLKRCTSEVILLREKFDCLLLGLA